jgi:polyphosphate kinase
VSDNIRVISVVGRFLEHSRAYYFRNGGQEEVFIASADWMPRNLDRRIEVAGPVLDPNHRNTVRDVMELMWGDNRQAWDLKSTGTYTQRNPGSGDEDKATHRRLIEQYRDGGRITP